MPSTCPGGIRDPIIDFLPFSLLKLGGPLLPWSACLMEVPWLLRTPSLAALLGPHISLLGGWAVSSRPTVRKREAEGSLASVSEESASPVLRR